MFAGGLAIRHQSFSDKLDAHSLVDPAVYSQ
jgi:hypothetical protein